MDMFYRIILFILLSIIPFAASAQKEWDDVDISKLSWTVSNEVYVYSNTLQDLNFWNFNTETKEDKKSGRFTTKRAYMGISWEVDIPWQITFTIQNNHNDHASKYKVVDIGSNGDVKESWYDGDIYWGFIVHVNNIGGGEENYMRYYADRKTVNSSYTFLDYYSSSINRWLSVNSTTPSFRTVQIVYDGNSKITVNGGIYNADEHWYTFNNAKSIKGIEVCAGVSANVQVKSFNIQIAAPFAHVVRTPVGEPQR